MTTSIVEIQKIIADQLSPISHILADQDISEIMVTADGRVWVEKSGEITKTEIILEEAQRALALIAVSKSIPGGMDMRAGHASSVISATMAGGRFAGALKPLDPRGTTLCIRKHPNPDRRPTLEQLIEWGGITSDQADVLVQEIIVNKKNAVVVGATSSGKTTLANAILAKIPPHERVGLIEDAPELSPLVENCDKYTTNAQNGLDARLLIKHAMRSRYDRLVLGETRGDDTFDLIRALSSGHNGSMTTVHANSAADGMSTIEMLYQMSVPQGAQVPVDVARRYLASAINVLVYCERSYESKNGLVRSVRKVKEICFVKPQLKDGQYDFSYF